MRLFTFLLLICFAVLLGVPYGLYVLPDLNWQLGLGLAVAMGVLIAIAVRVMLVALLGGLVTAIGLFLLITLASQYFFFAVERDRWFGNQDELPQVLPLPERDTAYLSAIGLEKTENPVFDWFNHSRYQAESALSSRQLSPNQVGTPRPAVDSQDVWQGWLYQLMMLLGCVFSGAYLGRKRS